jgi:N-acetylglutamate synthase-like GNAT family acetyltransferase
MLIRKAEIADIDGINELIKEFSIESLSKYGFYFNENHIHSMIDRCKDQSFVIDINGSIVGIIAGEITKSIANGELIYQEIIWFVSKNHRRYGLRLLSEVERYCKQNGVNKIVMVHLSNSLSDKLKELYFRLGYKQLEVQYIKELE